MNKGSPKSGHRVKDQHFLASPQLLQYPSKHKNTEHVEEDMGQVGMHEHMGDYLMWFETEVISR